MKRVFKLITGMVLSLGMLAGCGGNTDEIVVISREDGSGTRGAFVELFGIEGKDASGNKADNTTIEASITNSTSVMMTSVVGNEAAIGYISLGSLNDSVKALTIDGASASAENIKNGTYKIARPFIVATKADASDAASDFLQYIMSSDGQAVIEDNGYISAAAGEAYSPSGKAGKVVVAGSSSVTPVMEKLVEAYVALNPGVNIELQQSDSSTGMQSTIDGICDIGMASRSLKDSETSAGLTPTTIAMDGIAVIVNNNNVIDGFSSEMVKAIFTGEATSWSEITD